MKKWPGLKTQGRETREEKAVVKDAILPTPKVGEERLGNFKLK